jgi:hypothetical protein
MTEDQEATASNVVAPIFGRPDLKHIPPATIIPGQNDPWTVARREAFDRLWGDYLIVSGECYKPSEDSHDADRRMDKLVDRQCKLIWQIIRTHVVDDRQLNCKFSLLRDLMPVPWTDGRHLALLESIRNVGTIVASRS